MQTRATQTLVLEVLHSKPNTLCETSHKEEGTTPTKPTAFSVLTMPENMASFRKPSSLLPCN